MTSVGLGLLPAALLASLVLFAGCTRTVETKRYQLRGEVVKLDPAARIATIRHDKIEGWMDAMTMQFPVKDEREFGVLKAGAQITATVFVQDLDYWIAEIKIVQ